MKKMKYLVVSPKKRYSMCILKLQKADEKISYYQRFNFEKTYIVCYRGY